MSDIFKIFRRQKSVKQLSSEDNTGSQENIDVNELDNSDNREQNGNNSNFRHLSVSSECSPGTFAISASKQNHGFKEPKGWRKSLRKLKLKKQDSTISASSDNITKIPPYATAAKQTKNSFVDRSTGKRWSYSPDLSEENVPGARELRGSLERNLSIKREAEEIEYLAKYREQKYEQSVHQHKEHPRSSTFSEYQAADHRLDNSNLSTFQSEENSLISAHAQLGRSHSTPNADFLLQNPFMEQNWSGVDSEEWTSGEYRDLSQVAMDTDPTYTSKGQCVNILKPCCYCCYNVAK